jgi:hypothetical protein
MSYNQELAREAISKTLIFDIETSSFEDGVPVSIKEDFGGYVAHAVVKWVGAYSYSTGEYYEFNALTEQEDIKELFNCHETLVGFNSEDFDYPIMKNNDLLPDKYFKHLDLMLILGNSKYDMRVKKRTDYMGVNLKKVFVDGEVYGANSLNGMAHAFGLRVVKGSIDYKVFFKESWTPTETESIIKYLRADVEVTKLLFDRTTDFWFLFVDWLYPEHVSDWSWIKTTIASLTYLASCKIKNVKPVYAEASGEKDEMGGRAVVPVQEETFGMHYLDETSKYPHIFSEFCLFSEVDVSGVDPRLVDKAVRAGRLFHGNEKFEVRGYYDIREQGVMEKELITKLKTRFAIKQVLKDYNRSGEKNITPPEELLDVIPNGLLTDEVLKKLKGLDYAIKIFANSLYGAVRSSVFERISSPNAGYDCCWLGQQIHEYIHKAFEEQGLRVVGGFTDSWFVEDKNVSKEEVLRIANGALDELKKFMPYPESSHSVGYECYADYLLYNFDDKKGVFKKNNYCFISGGRVKIVGFPIMKDNSSKLAIKIFREYLEPLGLKNNRLKFKKVFVDKIIRDLLSEDIGLAAVTIKCNRADTYKLSGQLQAQVSRVYLNGGSGEVDVIKNTRLGKVGKGCKYCSVDEAVSRGLVFEDLVLDKVYNELAPFLITEDDNVNLSEWDL